MALKKANTPAPAEEVQVKVPTEEEMTPGIPPVEEETEEVTETTTPEVPTETPAVEPEEEAEEREETPPEPDPQPEPEPKQSTLEKMLSNVPTSGGVQVDTSVLTPDPENIPEEPKKNVRIRMREDHRCTIAMRQYIFEKGKCYDVPPNVKKVLNKRGLLSPL